MVLEIIYLDFVPLVYLTDECMSVFLIKKNVKSGYILNIFVMSNILTCWLKQGTKSKKSLLWSSRLTMFSIVSLYIYYKKFCISLQGKNTCINNNVCKKSLPASV